MKTVSVDSNSAGDMAPLARRRLFLGLLGASVLAPLAACERSRWSREEITLSVVLYSYLTRPIIDIYLNRDDLGVAAPYGSTGIVTGVTFPFGVQKLNWRLDGPRGTPNNGDTIHVKNTLTLGREQILADTRYIGVHIYPDFTAEMLVCDDMPDLSRRGEQLVKDRVQAHDDKMYNKG